MRGVDYEFMFNIEEKFWWYTGMRRITDTLLADQLRANGLKILDAGCGTGMNLVHFGNAGHSAFGFDFASEAIARARRRGLANITRASITQIPYLSESFDLAYSFEVIDEVPDIGKALAELNRVLKPGGYLLLRLPAFDWLHSPHDVDIGTLHRFTLKEMREKLETAGFEIESATYANCLLFPIVAIRRLLKRLGIGGGTDTKPMPAGLQWLDPIFLSMLKIEAEIIGRGGSLPFGLSAIVLARKL
jgi:SAM-dependent methyltransferase